MYLAASATTASPETEPLAAGAEGTPDAAGRADAAVRGLPGAKTPVRACGTLSAARVSLVRFLWQGIVRRVAHREDAGKETEEP